MKKCARCGVDTNVTTMSYFNEDILCVECSELERRHPDFARAQAIEERHVRDQDLNYKGVGLPEGYREWAERQTQRSLVPPFGEC